MRERVTGEEPRLSLIAYFFNSYRPLSLGYLLVSVFGCCSLNYSFVPWLERSRPYLWFLVFISLLTPGIR